MGSGCESRAAAQLLARKSPLVTRKTSWEGRPPKSNAPAFLLAKPGDRCEPPPLTIPFACQGGLHAVCSHGCRYRVSLAASLRRRSQSQSRGSAFLGHWLRSSFSASSTADHARSACCSPPPTASPPSPESSDGQYRLQVLAPGFAPQRLDVTVPQASVFTIKLCVAAQPRSWW